MSRLLKKSVAGTYPIKIKHAFTSNLLSFPFVLIEIVSDNTFFRKSYLITQEGNNVSLNNVLIKNLHKPKIEFNHIIEIAKLATMPNRLFDGYIISGRKSSLLSSPAIFTFLTVYDGKRLYCSIFYNLKILSSFYNYNNNKEISSYIKQGENIRKIIEELDNIDYNIL